MAAHTFVGRTSSLLLLTFAGLAFGASGCTSDNEHKSIDGTISSDGYALFSVDNGRQQQDDVTVSITNADAGATYVLIYNGDPPKDVGWFQFDPSTTERCGGDLGPHCLIDGYGYMVDYAKVPDGATEVDLHDGRCGCDADHYQQQWTGNWAVLRVERTSNENQVTFDVWARKVKDFAEQPKIDQLQ